MNLKLIPGKVPDLKIANMLPNISNTYYMPDTSTYIICLILISNNPMRNAYY